MKVIQATTVWDVFVGHSAIIVGDLEIGRVDNRFRAPIVKVYMESKEGYKVYFSDTVKGKDGTWPVSIHNPPALAFLVD